MADNWFMVRDWVTAHLPWESKSPREAKYTLCGRRITKPVADVVLVPRCKVCLRCQEAWNV
jgi:hypothetical protein